jgi:hypothetical protein
MKYQSTFQLGQRVRLVHDPLKETRMIVQVSFGGTGTRYNLMCGSADTWNYESEIEAVEEVGQTVVHGFKPTT